MKLSTRHNHSRNAYELLIKAGRDEVLDRDALRWLESGAHEVYLRPLPMEAQDKGREVLRYDVTDLMSLRRRLRREGLDAKSLSGLLVDLAKALARLSSTGRYCYSVLFDPAFVYVDAVTRLRLVHVPLEGVSFKTSNSPLSLLRVLAASSERQSFSPQDRLLCERLAEFVSEERKAFSLNRFRDFVREVTGVIVMPDGTTRDANAAHGEPSGMYVLRDLTNGDTFSVREGIPLHMGRGATCDVRLSDRPEISRDHATLCVDEGRVTLMDLGSTNGTYVKGKGLLPSMGVSIPIGQVFSLSNERFRVERGWEGVCSEC
ncbi:MAG: FHA domain-containing protein [Atopobiaceae bacterium]|nr:FHA domain-containing protein [Atopobiaceae bacterium]